MAWVEPVIDAHAPDGWRFEVKTGTLSKEREAELKEGTIGRSSGGTCILTGTSMPFSYVREEGQSHGLGVRLMAVVAGGTRGRIYLTPSEEHLAAAEQARPAWEPEGELPNNPRDFKTPNYGMRTFDQSLLQFVQAGVVSIEEAMEAASSPHDFQLALQQAGVPVPAGLHIGV